METWKVILISAALIGMPIGHLLMFKKMNESLAEMYRHTGDAEREEDLQ